MKRCDFLGHTIELREIQVDRHHGDPWVRQPLGAATVRLHLNCQVCAWEHVEETTWREMAEMLVEKLTERMDSDAT